MSHCEHGENVLKCSNSPLCKKCVKEYCDSNTVHILESLDYPKVPDASKFLGRLIELEQTATSELIEYLDNLKDKLAAHLDGVFAAIKERVIANCCRQNMNIQSMLDQADTPTFQENVEYYRKSQRPTNSLVIDEERFINCLRETILDYSENDLQFSADPPLKRMVDVLDNRKIRIFSLSEAAVSCEYKKIEGHFYLFPESRYCFIDDEHMVFAGGKEGQYVFHNAYFLSTQSGQSHVLPALIHPRAQHALCPYKEEGIAKYVYAFGGSDTKRIERLPLVDAILTCLEHPEVEFDADNQESCWEHHGELRSALETASCVQHSSFIYLTGSHPSAKLKVIRIDPRKEDPSPREADEYSFLGMTVRLPCALAVWHTQMVLLYSDGAHHFSHKWTVGNKITDNTTAQVKLQIEDRRMDWTQVCPPVTIDSNCFMMLETAAGTVLLRYNFIKRTVCFPAARLSRNGY